MENEAGSLPVLTAAEARVLGSLIEKKELTPDVYPMSLNGLHAAANQKTARDPVMALEQTAVRHALRQLEQKGLVRQVFASRVERYEHQLAQRFSLTHGQASLIGLMLLRGMQTAHELLARGERMTRYASIDELNGDLDLLMGRKHPLVQLLERGPGQREDRYMHLLAGPVASVPPTAGGTYASADPNLEARVKALEERVADLQAIVDSMRTG